MLECLKLVGVEARVQPVQLAVTWPASRVMYTCGLADKELREVGGTSYKPYTGNGGWNGHVVVVTKDQLIDPAFDQVFPPLGLPHYPQMLVIDSSVFWGMQTGGKVGAGLIVDKGENDKARLEVQYVLTEDKRYEESEAWQDEGLPFLAAAIMSDLKGVKHFHG